jgi:hypothetical protein
MKIIFILNKKTNVIKRNIEIGVSGVLTSPYLMKYLAVEFNSKKNCIYILMNYYERGSLSHLCSEAEKQGKVFSERV